MSQLRNSTGSIGWRGLAARMLLACILLAAGCATDDAMRGSERLVLDGRYEEGLQAAEALVRANPDDRELRVRVLRLREITVARLLAAGEAARRDSIDMAEQLYRQVLRIEPGNQRAQSGLDRLAAERRHRAMVAKAEEQIKRNEYADAEQALREVLLENPGQRQALAAKRRLDEAKVRPPAPPKLKADLTKLITLRMRDASLRSVLDVLAEATGASFVLDKDVRADAKVTISMRDASLEDVLRTLLVTNQLESKVVNETSVMLYPNTPQKHREYRELVVRTFYLGNADVKQTAELIASIVKTRDIFIDEKLGMLVMRDTQEAVRLAERLVAAHDLAEPEVMLEVEVLEVVRSRLQELGLRFPSTIAWSLAGAAGIPGTVSLTEWLNRSSGLVSLSVTDPLFIINLMQRDGATSVLANPRIRARNKERARIHIGDRVPVITTSAAAVGGFVSQSVSYIDVGLKFEVEPTIHLGDEIGIRLGLEVSNIVRQVSIPGTAGSAGTLAYQIGTRTASTVLRLRDGETEVIAGLISDEDRSTADRVPGLGTLPIVGRLFSSIKDDGARTEIVLLITPRILRSLARPDPRFSELPAGTDATTMGGAPGSAPRFVAPPRPTAATPASPSQQPMLQPR